MSPENPLLIVRELCARLGLSPEERASYERRLARAVWLDRAEVLETSDEYGVGWFARRMLEKLRENDHKRGWDDIDLDYALMRLREEVEELAPLVGGWDHDQGQAREMIREAADVGNFALFIALKARGWSR